MSTPVPAVIASSPLVHGPSGADWKAAHDALKADDKLWQALAFEGVQHDGGGGLVEHRRCPHCTTTLSRPISPEHAVELCRHQAVIHAHSAEAISDAGKAPKKRRRGFAAMSKEKHRAIASLGGKTAHQKGRAHRFTTEEARAAGRRGGQAISENSEHMAEIGRCGGLAIRAKHHKRPAE